MIQTYRVPLTGRLLRRADEHGKPVGDPDNNVRLVRLFRGLDYALQVVGYDWDAKVAVVEIEAEPAAHQAISQALSGAPPGDMLEAGA